MDAITIILLALVLLVIFTISKGLRIIKQSQTMIIERLGRYHTTLSSGVNIAIILLLVRV